MPTYATANQQPIAERVTNTESEPTLPTVHQAMGSVRPPTLKRGYDKKLEPEKESENPVPGERNRPRPEVNENGRMGFNPHRKQKKRAGDVYIVVLALAITLALVLWAFSA
jgi:hypothetical protein